jgi:hypothetical protein
VASPSLTQKMPSLPIDILELYPDLEVEKLNHSSTTFVLNDHTYDKYLKRAIEKEPDAGDFERFGVVKSTP